MRLALPILAAAALMAYAAWPYHTSAAGPYAVVPLPPGVTDMVLSENGSSVAATSVIFNQQRGIPEQVVTVVDPRSGRVRWRANLPAASCCAFPVFAATPDVRWIAVGGATRVELFRGDGARTASLELAGSGSLNNALRLSRDGGRLVAGQAEGEVTTFALHPPRRLWHVRVERALLDLALRTDGEEVAVVTSDAVVGLSSREGKVRYRVPLDRVVVAAAAEAGRGFAVAWKGAEETLTVGVLEGGRWRWRRTLGRVTVPLLQTDPSGRWTAVSDFLGQGAWLLDRDGQLAWRASRAPAAVGLGPNGRVAAVRGDLLEVRGPKARRLCDFPGGPTWCG